MLKQTLLTFGLFLSLSNTFIAQNLILNGDCEMAPVNGKIPNWIEVVGTEWRPNNGDAPPQSGLFYFYAGGARNAELMQEVNVAAFACSIDASKQKFDFSGYVRSFPQSPTDQSRIVIEYCSVTLAVLATYDSNNQTNTNVWKLLTDSRTAPVGTRKIRIRLISTLRSGTDNDGYYDNLSLTPNPAFVHIDSIRRVTAMCNLPNGTAHISVSGGVLPLQFKMDNTVATADSIFKTLLGGNHNIVVTDAANCSTNMAFTIANLPPPTLVTAQATPSVCGRNNGSLKVMAQSGTGSLTYQLGSLPKRSQTKFDSLLAGRYLLTIRDSIGCTDTSTVVIADKAKPIIDSLRTLPASCNKNNGQITVFSRGFTPNLQYSLDSVRFVGTSIFPNLKDSSYIIFVIDTNKCSASQTVNIARLASPKFDSVIVKPTSCAFDNGSISVVARNVTFSLDSLVFNTKTQFLNLKSGNYTIYIRDSANCTISQKSVVAKIPKPTITEVKVLPESCKKNDGQIIIKASSPASSLTYSIGTNYTPRDSFLNLPSGIYTVVVRDTFSCSYVQNATIQSQPTPIIEEIKTTPSVCNSASGVILIKAKGGADLLFSIDGTQFQADALFRNVKTGKYNVIIKDRADCSMTVQTEVARECGLFVPTAFSPNEDSFNDFFTFFGDASKFDKVLDFKVFNRWGSLIFSDNTVQINNPSNGWDGKFRGQDVETGIYVYFIKIQMKDGTTVEEKGDVTLLR